ncbi:MAG: DUF1761 domain-containing protein [Nanoarchaeota archaeon]
MVNYLSILSASVFSFIVGMVWYSPALFGNKWAKLASIDFKKPKNKISVGVSMLLGFLSTLILASVFQYIINLLKISGPAAGATLGFWFWLGFLATSLLGVILWEGKPWALYILNATYWLINLVVIGAVLGYWA